MVPAPGWRLNLTLATRGAAPIVRLVRERTQVDADAFLHEGLADEQFRLEPPVLACTD
jgi:hypothetical protein